MSNDTNNRPAKEFRLGHVKATIWANSGRGAGIRHSVTVTRLYKEGDVWKSTGSFGRDDLPLVARVAEQAHGWIYSQAQEAHKATRQGSGKGQNAAHDSEAKVNDHEG